MADKLKRLMDPTGIGKLGGIGMKIGKAAASRIKSKRDLKKAQESAARGERANPEANRKAKERYAKSKAAKKAKADAAEKPADIRGHSSTSNRPYSPVVNTGPQAKTPATKPLKPQPRSQTKPKKQTEVPKAIKKRMRREMGAGY
tara:strand:+ start:231 stop:665 length:435 start_codon:yes stop_codon:yes gene_type:complete